MDIFHFFRVKIPVDQQFIKYLICLAPTTNYNTWTVTFFSILSILKLNSASHTYHSIRSRVDTTLWDFASLNFECMCVTVKQRRRKKKYVGVEGITSKSNLEKQAMQRKMSMSKMCCSGYIGFWNTYNDIQDIL